MEPDLPTYPKIWRHMWMLPNTKRSKLDKLLEWLPYSETNLFLQKWLPNFKEKLWKNWMHEDQMYLVQDIFSYHTLNKFLCFALPHKYHFILENYVFCLQYDRTIKDVFLVFSIILKFSKGVPSYIISKFPKLFLSEFGIEIIIYCWKILTSLVPFEMRFYPTSFLSWRQIFLKGNSIVPTMLGPKPFWQGIFFILLSFVIQSFARTMLLYFYETSFLESERD